MFQHLPSRRSVPRRDWATRYCTRSISGGLELVPVMFARDLLDPGGRRPPAPISSFNHQ